MYLRALMLVLLTTAISGCGSSNSSDETYLTPMQSKDAIVIPAKSAGSEYADMMLEIYSDGRKNEYETEAAYRSRVSQMPSELSKKYGSYFAFKISSSIQDNMKYDADSELLKFKNKNSSDKKGEFILGQNTYEEFKAMFGIIVVNCQNGLNFKLNSEKARFAKEDPSAAYFVKGTIDFSENNSKKHKKYGFDFFEKLPGFQYMAFESYDGSDAVSLYSNFKADEFLIVDSSNGSVIAQNDCKR